MRDDILEIRMQTNTVECCVCGAETPHRWGVPIYNGDIVSNHFPDDMWEGGQAVCKRCFDDHAAGRMPTYDHWYVTPGPLGVALTDGGGI